MSIVKLTVHEYCQVNCSWVLSS